MFLFKKVIFKKNSSRRNFLSFWSQRKFRVSRIIYCSRSLHFWGFWSTICGYGVPYPCPKASSRRQETSREVKYWISMTWVWPDWVVSTTGFLSSTWCLRARVGYPYPQIVDQNPQKWRDLEQQIILDIRNFLWLQKLEKFRPGENMKKQVLFLFILQKHSFL